MVALAAAPSANLRDAGTGVYRGRVERDLGGVPGARVFAVELPAERAPLGPCEDLRVRACVCDAARDFAAELEARNKEPVPVAAAVSGDGGWFALTGLPPRFGLWVDAPDAGSRWFDKPGTGALELLPGVTAEGQVVDTAGAPISGAIVTTRHASGRLFDAATDAQGRFRLGPLGGIAERVFVRSAGYLPRAAGLDKPIALERTRTLRVSVRHADGGAAGGVEVKAAEFACTGSARTGADGVAQLDTLVPQSYEITAGEPTYGGRVHTFVREGTSVAAVVMRPRAELEVEVKRAQSELTTLQVACGDRFEEHQVTPPLKMGFLSAAGCALRLGTQRRWVPLTPGQRASVTLTEAPSRATEVQVELVDARGRPLEAPDADVTWRRQGEEEASSGMPVVLEPGTWLISAQGPDLTGIEQTVVAPAKSTVRVRTLPRPTVKGRVTEANGSPVAGAQVFFTREDRMPLGPGTTSGEDGSFSIPAPRLGSVRLSALAGDDAVSRWTRATVQVSPRGATTRLKMEPLKRTTAKVVSVDGGAAPVTSLQLLARDVVARVKLVDGGFDLALPEGTYRTSELPFAAKFRAGDRGVVLRWQPPPERIGPRLRFAPDAGYAMVPDSLPGQPEPEVKLGWPRLAELKVLDAAGAPVAQAELLAISQPWTGKEILWCGEGRAAEVDDHGRGLVPVIPGERVRVRAPGFISVDVSPEAGEVRLAAGAGALTGKVSQNGRPATTARLCLSGGGDNVPVPLGAEGAFSVSGLEPGRYRYLASETTGRPNDAYFEVEGTVNIPAGRATVNIVLRAKPEEREE